jgi:hypothetical protein
VYQYGESRIRYIRVRYVGCVERFVLSTGLADM